MEADLCLEVLAGAVLFQFRLPDGSSISFFEPGCVVVMTRLQADNLCPFCSGDRTDGVS